MGRRSSHPSEAHLSKPVRSCVSTAPPPQPTVSVWRSTDFSEHSEDHGHLQGISGAGLTATCQYEKLCSLENGLTEFEAPIERLGSFLVTMTPATQAGQHRQSRLVCLRSAFLQLTIEQIEARIRVSLKTMTGGFAANFWMSHEDS